MQVEANVAAGPRPVTPRVPEWKERLIRAVAITAVLYATYWIAWRWTSTINTDPRAVAVSILLLVAETWAYVNMCLFVFICWRLRERNPPPAPPGRTVDVFITCYDEPLEIVRRTAFGARAIRYPHRTYVLDDGKRDDMMAMCADMGIGYIRRVGNANAKAGNLNFALSVTDGEFILQLDADHVPLPNILDRMLGHFEDPKMAMVQSPQDFYNVDSFTHIVNDEGRRLWEENRIFYSLIQPGRDNWGASFFCGSCGILRRSALADIGGFATQTIIEDMETTIELQRRGWKTAYHNETLAYGLAPGAAGAYHVQRMRWGQGAMQILRKLKPLTLPGLTLAQRINYFAGTATYFEGWQKFVFYMMPLVFFYTGILPVDVDETQFLLRLVPYLVLAIAAFELLSRGTGYLLITERFTMVRFVTYMLTVSALFTRKPLKFNVTPKGKSGVAFRTYAPQLALLILSICAPIWATLAHANGWIDYGANGWHSLAFWINSVWALWNTWFAAYVVRHCLVMRQQRSDHRFSDHLPVRVRSRGDREPTAALAQDLNPAGLGFRSTRRFEPGTRVTVDLPLSNGPVRVSGTLRHVHQHETHAGPVWLHGVQFTDTKPATADAIELHCTQHAIPIWRQRYRQSIDIITRASEVFRNGRRGRRRLLQLPAVVTPLDDTHSALGQPDTDGLLVLEEISPRGARLVGNYALSPGSRLRIDVAGADISEYGVVRYVNALETTMAVHFEMGVELTRDATHSVQPAEPRLARAV